MKKIKFLNKYLILITCIVVLFSACKSPKHIDNTSQNNIDDNQCISMIFTDKPYSEIESDYYQVDSVFIESNCMNIWVTYSGGCGDSEFILYYNNLIMNSMPPKANILLVFKDYDDCRAEVQEKLKFNVSFFDDHLKNGGINIRLAGIGKSILYKQ